MQWRIGHYIRIDRIEIIERLNIMDARSLGLIDLMGYVLFLISPLLLVCSSALCEIVCFVQV